MSNPASSAIESDADAILKAERFITKLTGAVGQAAYARIIDLLLRWVNETRNMSPSVESRAIMTAEILVSQLGVAPPHYFLRNVTSSREVEASGGIANIHKGNVQGIPVCVKTVRMARDTNPRDVLKDVSREGILWDRLRHPNILPFYGIYHDGTKSSLVCPWMQNGDLVSFLGQHPHSNRILLVHDVALGSRFLHERFIVHGDLKGANVLVTDSGKACISDFGFSSILPFKGGTVPWQAPELFLGDDGAPNTRESDIYAFGCLAYEVFSGQRPFANVPGMTRIVAMVTAGHRPKRPADSSPSWNHWGLTEAIWALIEGCWDKHPTNRPTIHTVIEHLAKGLPEDTRAGDGDFLRSTEGVREMLRRSATDLDTSAETFGLPADLKKAFEDEFRS